MSGDFFIHLFDACLERLKVTSGTTHQGAYMWPPHVSWASSQHGSLSRVRLLAWWLRIPRASVLANKVGDEWTLLT